MQDPIYLDDNATTPEAPEVVIAQSLWPSPDYERQIEQLRAAIGETIFLAELSDSPVQLGVRLTATPYVLLGLIDFPRPDPTRGLAPHLLLLDDGRGVNLGRIARISRRRAFDPTAEDLLYLDANAHQALLFGERRLSRDSIAQRSRAVLGQVLGKSNRKTLVVGKQNQDPDERQPMG
jgi:hypothetical protein